MPDEPTALRAAAAEALRILDDPQLTSEARVAAAGAVLRAALAATAALTDAQRAALDADPGVQAALRRLADDDGAGYLAGPDGAPSDVRVAPSADARPVGPGDLARLGL